jgi:hypothetical protein
MKNTKILLAVLAVALVSGMTACGGGGGGSAPKPNTDPKTIVITGLPDSYSYGDILIFTAGTSIEDLVQGKGFVAGASWDNFDIVHPRGSITYPLYNPGTNNGRWKGNGTYDVYWFYTAGEHNSSTNPIKIYKASVSFTEATTSVAFSKFADTGITENDLD